LNHKQQLVNEFIKHIQPQTVLDLGANVGMFSRIASDKKIPTLAFDIDPAAIEKLYLDCRENDEPYLLPLLIDLSNPSPGLGWEHQERMSFLERTPCDTVLALALIHHLAMGNNVPLREIAEFFSKICRFLIIEFVPKSDSQVQRLLVTREDIFSDYNQQTFEDVFSKYFKIHDVQPIKESERILYLMESITLSYLLETDNVFS
jgi:ribosomal protein L11 methylase PrmA